MNDNWNIKQLAIVESDDTEDQYDRNGLNMLFYWKAKYSKFKISLFTIPNRTSREMIALLKRESDWIELLVHGFSHSSNFECFDWDYTRTKELIEPCLEKGYKRIFKAPGWTITPDLCGYPAREDQLISKDKQGVYKALADLDYIISDRHYNKERRLENGKYICVDCQSNLVHMHTWPMPQGAEPNGYQQVEERGVPWNHDTTFKFLTEAWEEGLIEPCK
ncbi:MAG: hypothetical protein ACRDFB_09970 [Rhabdochlamydiaceae bacterium]